MAFHMFALAFTSVEEERIAMNNPLAKAHLPKNVLLRCHARVFAFVTCVMLAYGCQSGAHTPIAPSAVASASAPTATESVASGGVITTQDAPVSYAMNEMVVNSSLSGSGYSGTCTVAGSHTGGLRVRADGQGVAGHLIQFNVVDVSSTLKLRTTDYVDVNQQGAFRVGWHAIEPGDFTAGDNLQCWLTEGGAVLASTGMTSDSGGFPAP